MAAPTSRVRTFNVNHFFETSAPPSAPAPQNSSQPSQETNSRRSIFSSIQSAVFAPARMGAAQATEGASNQFIDVLSARQGEITERIQAIFRNALIRQMPPLYHSLLVRIRTFLQQPTQSHLEALKTSLSQINVQELEALVPDLNYEGKQSLITLKSLLETELLEQANPTSSALNINDNETVKMRLERAEDIINHFLQREGALLQTLNALTQNITAPNGLVTTLRQQLNDPQTGIVTEALNNLRQTLTSRVNPAVIECKTALEAYRQRLSNNPAPNDAIPSEAQHLLNKLSSLQQGQVSQLTPEQWGKIQSFKDLLSNYIQDPTQYPITLVQTHEPFQILDIVMNAQRGMVQEVVDMFVDGIRQGIDQVVQTPRRMINNLFSPQAVPSQPVNPTPPTQQPPQQPAPPSPQDNSAPSFFNLEEFQTKGREYLGLILNSVGTAASQHSASALATAVELAFEKIKSHLTQNQNNSLTTTIDSIIVRLGTAKQNSSWNDLNAALGQAFDFMQNQLVFLQSIRLPLNPVRIHSSTIPGFLQNISIQQDLLQPPGQRTPQDVSSMMIAQQENVLKSRASTYGPARIIIEKICGMPGGVDFYAEIFRLNDSSLTDATPIFRDRLFEKIDQSEINVVRKWFAKRTFDFLMVFSKFYINSFIDGFLTLAQQTVNQPQHLIEETAIKSMRNWLAVTSGAYNSVAAAPVDQTRDFFLMLEEAIKKPERNGGLNQKELFGATAKTVLDTFGPQIKLNEAIDRYFNVEIPTASPVHFLNPLLKGLNIFCSFCLKGIVFVPQWLGNQFLKAGAKVVLSQTSFLNDYTQQTMESLRRNTPTSFAMQKLIYVQLQKIFTVLQQSLNENSPEYLPRNTNIKKIEIRGLVECLLEVLNKSQYHTPDRLRDYIQHQSSLRDRMGREIEEAALPAIMETAVTTLSIALRKVTEQKGLQQMLYDGLCVANRSFESEHSATDEEFVALEEANRKLIKDIVGTAIFHATGQAFDFRQTKQKRDIQTFVQSLKTQTETFTSNLKRQAQQLEQNSPHLDSAVLNQQISSAIELSTQYHYQRVDAQGRADGNPNLHVETKYHLNESSRRLLEKCQPIVTSLSQMKTATDNLVHDDQILRPLMLSQHLVNTIETRLQQGFFSAQNITFCKTQVALLRTYLARLRQNQCSADLLNAMERYAQEASSSLQCIETAQKANEAYPLINQLLRELKQAKLQSLTRPHPHLSTLEKQILRHTNSLPGTQKTQFNEKILQLMLARTRQAVEVTASNFIATYLQVNAHNLNELNGQATRLRAQTSSLKPLLLQRIETYAQQCTQNRNQIKQLASNLNQQASDLEECSTQQNGPEIWTPYVFDMQGFTQWINSLASDQANSKIDQLFEALYLRHNYFSFLNQVCLLPFLEKFGKHHLRTNG
jgi:hypothetical protein